MITNSNQSREPGNGSFVDVKKYIGVASVNIVGVNPSNEQLRMHGWSVPENADEPQYVTTDKDGKKAARVRILARICDLPEKPVVGLDFWVRPEIALNKEGKKCKIIDAYGRTAWGTKAEIQAHKVPEYTNGPASISKDYKVCHVGEEDLVLFLMKYLNVTPLQVLKNGSYVPTKNPGMLTIDNWKALCDGDVKEIKEAIALQPENKIKVILGVRTNEENKSFQSFLSTRFIGNGARPNTNGEYDSAVKAIDEFVKYHPNATVSFSACPVKEWGVTSTEVVENTEELPSYSDSSYFENNPNDLPFDD